MKLFGIRMPRSNLNAGNRRLHVRARIWMLVMHFLNWMTQIQNPLTEKLNRMTRELIWIVIFTARQNPANLNKIKMNLIVKFANLAGKSYINRACKTCMHSSLHCTQLTWHAVRAAILNFNFPLYVSPTPIGQLLTHKSQWWTPHTCM